MGLLNQQNSKQSKKGNNKNKPGAANSKFIVKPTSNTGGGFVKKAINKSSNRGS